MMIESVRHTINERNEEGELQPVDRVEYEFGDGVSEEAKEAVRNHVPRLTKKSEIRRVIESVGVSDAE